MELTIPSIFLVSLSIESHLYFEKCNLNVGADFGFYAGDMTNKSRLHSRLFAYTLGQTVSNTLLPSRMGETITCTPMVKLITYKNMFGCGMCERREP